jgi:hypothetical protein
MAHRKCIFCSALATEYEHVIPRWMPAHLDIERQLMSHDTAFGVTRAKHIRVDDVKAKIVCSGCHDVITDRIESTASALLKQLMTGQARLLTVAEQGLLAAWGAKTAAAFWGQTQRGRGVPVAHRRHLIKQAEAHPNVFVALTRCDGTNARGIFGRTRITLAGSGQVLPIYHFALAFGTIGVKVYGPGNGRTRLEYKDLTSLGVRVSPAGGEVKRWPPGRILDWDEFTAFSDLDIRANR